MADPELCRTMCVDLSLAFLLPKGQMGPQNHLDKLNQPRKFPELPLGGSTFSHPGPQSY